MIVYVITMYRWGDEESHSYLYGVETDKKEAIRKAAGEEVQRGGKYEAEIAEIEIGHSTTRKYIKKIFSRQSSKNKDISKN